MFIMLFAREVRLAQTKPTRAPVLGLSLCPPTSERLKAAQGRGKAWMDARFTNFLSTFCPAVDSRVGCRVLGGNSVLCIRSRSPYRRSDSRLLLHRVRFTPRVRHQTLTADLMPRKR